MTDLRDLLEEAVDVAIPVDPTADVRRGRAHLHRGRVRRGALVVGGCALAGALVAAGVVSLTGSRSQSTEQQDLVATQPPQSPHRTHHANGHRVIRTPKVGADQLTHTQYFDVPPSPAGWHLVGTAAGFVSVAPDGRPGASVADDLMVLVDFAFDPSSLGATPVDFDGRTFWIDHDSDPGSTQIGVKDRYGRWLVAAYPDSAGFAVPDMVAYLDAVQPQPASLSLKAPSGAKNGGSTHAAGTHSRRSDEQRKHHVVHAAKVAAGSLQHTQYFDVPPAPTGWHLVGGNETIVMIAPDGTSPSVDSGFEGKLIVGLQSGFDPGEPGLTAYDFDGRTFWESDDSGTSQIWVKRNDTEWVTVQWPDSAGFTVDQMVALLDAVQVLPGAMSAS